MSRHLNFSNLLVGCTTILACLIFCATVFAQSAGDEDPQPQVSFDEQDDVVRLSDTITGNQEQPKVLYVIPWQEAEDKSILYQSLKSNFSDVFGHLDESEHKREVDFLESFVKHKRQKKREQAE